MDGYQASKEIRLGAAGEINKSIPIIAMTANAMQGDKEKCLNSGMSDYLSKPIEPELLLTKLKTWLLSNSQSHSNENTPEYNDTKVTEELVIPKTDKNDNTNKKQDFHNNEQEKPVINDEMENWNMTACLNRVRNNEKLLNMLINTFFEDMPDHLTSLKKAVMDRNLSQIHYYAHTIKGIAGNLSALKLSHQANTLEQAAKEGKESDLNKLYSELLDIYQVLTNEFSSYLNNTTQSPVS